MREKIQLRIFDIVGGPVWVSHSDGQKVYEKIVAAFKAKRSVELSFANRDNLITAFLNVAIGQLFNGDYSEAFLQENLTAVEIRAEDRAVVDRAITNAKRYFANRAVVNTAFRKAVGDEEE